MSAPSVFVLGGYQTDFARHATREGKDLAALMAEAAMGACEDARVDPKEIEVGHVGNFIGEIYSGQGHLGGLLVEAHPAFAGMPCSRHEAACASGGVALLAAMADLEAGRYDVAIVVGVELMRALPAFESQAKLAAAAWVPRETEGAKYPWAEMFDRVLGEYEERYGAPTRAHLAALAKNAFDNARKNERAQTREWAFGATSFAEDDAVNPVVAGRIRRQDCSQITDGACAVVLASARYLERAKKTHARVSRIVGWGHRTARMALADKLVASRGQPYVFPEVRRAITDAYARANIAGPEALDTFEAHDCFTPTAFLAVDHLGLAEPGKAACLVEEGVVLAGGRLPMNPGGGLMGIGHPVGATGVRMILDATKQVTGRAGATQVEDAKRALTLNIGGSTTTTVCFIVERGAA